jgi:hypothetical protein
MDFNIGGSSASVLTSLLPGEHPTSESLTKFKVILRLVFYRQSVLLGVKPLRATTRNFFSAESS